MSLMSKKVNWNNVEASTEFAKVVPGGYICGITAVKDVEEKEYFLIEFDIADGEFKGYYKDLYDAKGFWGASFVKSYKDKAQSYFKSFLDAVAASNKGFDVSKYDGDPNKLKGKYIGLVLAEEEYKAKDGSTKERLYVSDILPVSKIQSGDYVVPALKPLTKEETGGFSIMSGTSDDNFPWE